MRRQVVEFTNRLEIVQILKVGLHRFFHKHFSTALWQIEIGLLET